MEDKTQRGFLIHDRLKVQRRYTAGVAAFAAVFLILSGIGLVVDRPVDGAVPESTFLALIGMLMLLLVVGLGTLAAWWIKRGRWAMGVMVGLAAVVVVILSAGESFAIAEAERCGCQVGRRHGTAEAMWVAFDTVPILKINDTIGWAEPQPLSRVSPRGSDSDPPLRRWLPALAVRFAVGFVLLAIARGLFELGRTPIEPRTT